MLGFSFGLQRYRGESFLLIESVLNLSPKLAVFDCDGTLWSGDAGEGFFDWELKRGVISDDIVRWARARYADYRAGKVSEDDMCGEMVTINRGLREADALDLARTFFAEKFVSRIFPEMKELKQLVRDRVAPGRDLGHSDR